MRVGMDFGTTNSGIAVYDGQTVRVLTLDEHAQTEVMRSVIYITRDHAIHIGGEAIHLYNSQNINRERRMGKRKVGRVEMLFAEIGAVATDVHILVDEFEPGRLLRSLKSALATNYSGTHLFGREYTLEDLIALFLRAARERAEGELGEPITAVTLGRPVHFVSAATAEDDARAEARLRDAAHRAGFSTIDFEFEPIAAAKHYALSVTTPQTILVYDFGGGTLDLTVMRLMPGESPHVLAIGGVGIAGDRFDQRLVEGALTPHFGRDVTWGDKGLPVPRTMIDQITSWETLPALATLEMRTFLHRMQAACSAPAQLYALESLIFNFYGFALFEAVESTKRNLSEAYFAPFRFVGRDIDIWQMITRDQFESLTRGEWRRIRAEVLETLVRAGLQPEQIQAVVRTGGSSSIPASLALLAELFGAEKLVEEDVFTGVTAGLGITAWERR
ncbi:MAG TPA: Hsp70 family protein [Aggregatilineales bacterium]|nr:Hsp70 family protein [Anaerolineales bacterium]HRE48757.1 Hsp70 family protein [Aggregatilineales bacterium]